MLEQVISCHTPLCEDGLNLFQIFPNCGWQVMKCKKSNKLTLFPTEKNNSRSLQSVHLCQRVTALKKTRAFLSSSHLTLQPSLLLQAGCYRPTTSQ